MSTDTQVKTTAPYIREQEIREVLDLLGSRRAIAITAKRHSGKSIFMAEFHRYLVEHGKPASRVLYDGHDFTASPNNRANIAQKCSDLVEDIMVATSGSVEPIVAIDGGDFLYMPRAPRGEAPFGSPQYLRLTEALRSPAAMEKLLEEMAVQTFHQYSQYREKLEAQVAREWAAYESNGMKGAAPPATALDNFKMRQRARIRRIVEASEASNTILSSLGSALQAGSVKAVFTRHHPFRLGTGGRYGPDPGLGKTYEEFVKPHVTRYSLPTTYSQGDARLYLMRFKDIAAEDVADAIADLTDGAHLLMKFSIQALDAPLRLGIGVRPMQAAELNKLNPLQAADMLAPIIEAIRQNSKLEA